MTSPRSAAGRACHASSPDLLGPACPGVGDHDADQLHQLPVPLRTGLADPQVGAGSLVAVADGQAPLRVRQVVGRQVLADPLGVEDEGAPVGVHPVKGDEDIRVAGHVVHVAALGRPHEDEEPVEGISQPLLDEGQAEPLEGHRAAQPHFDPPVLGGVVEVRLPERLRIAVDEVVHQVRVGPGAARPGADHVVVDEVVAQVLDQVSPEVPPDRAVHVGDAGSLAGEDHGAAEGPVRQQLVDAAELPGAHRAVPLQADQVGGHGPGLPVPRPVDDDLAAAHGVAVLRQEGAAPEQEEAPQGARRGSPTCGHHYLPSPAYTVMKDCTRVKASSSRGAVRSTTKPVMNHTW